MKTLTWISAQIRFVLLETVKTTALYNRTMAQRFNYQTTDDFSAQL